jgi:hypothetical protein
MHQVLGKRVNTPLPRDLNQPVKPMTPAEAPPAVRSDSRLDARTNVQVRESHQAPADARAAQARQSAGERLPPPSTQTSFTASARSIADLMLRFPASSSAVRVAQPLFPTSHQSPAPTQVADRLQGSVRDSGLFYESHLSRWYRGELPREQLLREPQMWRPLTFTQAASTPLPPTPLRSSLPAFLLGLSRGAEGGLPGQAQAGSATANPAGLGAGMGASGQPLAAAAGSGQPGLMPGAGPAASPASALAGAEARESAAQVQQQQAANVELATQSGRLQRGEVIHESLQGLVRHQLELLAAPVLRWEGDVWSGIFMAMMIQPPARRDERGMADEEQASDESGGDEWRSSMTLEVAGLGQVGVKIWLRGSSLDLELAAHDPDVRLALAEGVDQLKARLQALDLNEVQIRLHHELPQPKPEAEPQAQPETVV